MSRKLKGFGDNKMTEPLNIVSLFYTFSILQETSLFHCKKFTI